MLDTGFWMLDKTKNVFLSIQYRESGNQYREASSVYPSLEGLSVTDGEG